MLKARQAKCHLGYKYPLLARYYEYCRVFCFANLVWGQVGETHGYIVLPWSYMSRAFEGVQGYYVLGERDKLVCITFNKLLN